MTSKAFKAFYFLTFVASSTLLLQTEKAEAASLKVLKTRNNQAIVEIPDEMTVKVGDTIKIDDGSEAPSNNNDDSLELSFDELESNSLANGSRGNYLSLTAGFPLVLSGGPDFSFALTGGFGWNLGSIEFAPELTLGYSNNFLMGLGVNADLNLVENKVGTTFVPGFTAGGSFSMSNGSAAMSFVGGVVGKFFLFKTSPTAIRLSITYEGLVRNSSLASTINILDVGLQTYF